MFLRLSQFLFLHLMSINVILRTKMHTREAFENLKIFIYKSIINPEGS